MSHFIRDLKRHAYYIVYGARVDLKAEVANSYLNRIWWVLEPFCEMLIFTFVFGTLFSNSEKYFPVFIYSGLIMWNFFSKTVNYSVSLVRRNKQIITKVYVPKFVFLLENMFLNFVKLLIAWSILVVMMVMFRVPFSFKMLYVLLIYFVFFVFCFAVGMVFLHLGVFVDDLSHAISIFLRLLFYISGIFYDIEKRFPAQYSSMMEHFNPIATLVGAMHDSLLYDTTPDMMWLMIWFVISIILLGIGIRTVYKYENSYVKAI